jgi:L-ribulose-5-phosphate 3-epimerase
MIKCMHYWSTPDGLANTQPIEDAISLAREHDFAGIELGIGPEGALTTTSSEQDCAAIRRQLDDAGLVCQTLASGMSWGASPTSDDADVRQQAIDLHAEALRRAAWLGCEAMLMVPGVVTSPIAPEQCVRYDVAIQRCREAVERLLVVAEEVGVDLCLENVWNGMLLSPPEWIDFLDSFGSERLGMYFDAGNLLGYHQHPPHWAELLGSRIKRVHLKDFKLNFDWKGSFEFSRLGEGDVPLAQTIAALRSIGYDKTIVAEMLPYSDGLLEHTSRAMDELVNK